MLKYIREILEIQGLSISEVARRVDVNRQTIYNELNNDMRISSLLKIASAMECRVGFMCKNGKFKEFTVDDLRGKKK